MGLDPMLPICLTGSIQESLELGIHRKNKCTKMADILPSFGGRNSSQSVRKGGVKAPYPNGPVMRTNFFQNCGRRGRTQWLSPNVAISRTRQLFPLQLFAFVFEDQHRVELIRADVIEAEVDAQLERGPEV